MFCSGLPLGYILWCLVVICVGVFLFGRSAFFVFLLFCVVISCLNRRVNGLCSPVAVP